MEQSKYSSPPSSSSRPSHQPPASTRQADPLHKLDRLALRLHWKSHLLSSSHAQAAALALSATELGAKAQQMFRLDFFEFYVLLERTLLLGLSAAGVGVDARRSSSSPPLAPHDQSDAARFIVTTRGRTPAPAPSTQALDVASTLPAATDAEPDERRRGAHAFHANLLRALSHPRSPFAATLASSTPASAALARAKALRNRWKEDSSTDPSENEGAEELTANELQGLLASILAGVDGGVGALRARLARGADAGAMASAMEGVEASGSAAGFWTDDAAGGYEAEWEEGVDAMEWEGLRLA